MGGRLVGLNAGRVEGWLGGRLVGLKVVLANYILHSIAYKLYAYVRFSHFESTLSLSLIG